MNLNELAKTVTLVEGKKFSISIAQVKEVIKILFTELANMDQTDVLKTIGKYKT